MFPLKTAPDLEQEYWNKQPCPEKASKACKVLTCTCIQVSVGKPATNRTRKTMACIRRLLSQRLSAQAVWGAVALKTLAKVENLSRTERELSQTLKTRNTEGRFLPGMNAGVSAPNIG